MIETAPVAYSTIPFVSALILLAVIVAHVLKVWKSEHHVYVSDVLWSLPFVFILLLVGGFVTKGWVLFEVGTLEMCVFSIAMLLFGFATQFRHYFSFSLSELSRFAGWGIRAFIACSSILFVSLISARTIDFIWFEESGSICLDHFMVSAFISLVLSLALYFLGQRSGALVALIPVAALGFGIAQYFVLAFKGAPIMPADLLALETAGAVAGGYDYLLTSRIIAALCVVGLCICALAFVVPGKTHSIKIRVGNCVVNFAVGVGLLFGCSYLFNTVKLDQITGVAYDSWSPILTYKALGFMPTFVEVAQDLSIEIPDNYDAEQTEMLISNLSNEFDMEMGSKPERQAAEKQFQELKPAIVVVMNETFTDMSIYDEICAAGYEGPQYYKSLSDVLQRGTLMVPALGGGTANTEFEFLTGNSLSFIGASKYPYQLYNFNSSDSVVKQLGELGYTSTAIHPQNPINWKRSKVYKELGFGEFLSQDSFEEAPCYHAGATDASTYDKILELLEQDSDPQFIFDVTMQNHGGYSPGTIPDEDMINLNVAGVDNQSRLNELGVYLACVERSDSDLAYFVEKLRTIERPIVLVFFGDHQPNVSTAIEYALNVNADTAERESKKRESTYVIWANYEVEGSSLNSMRETSSSKLAAEVLYNIGAPLTDRQKADLMLSKSVSAINITGYRGADGLRYALDEESPYHETLNQMQSIQYLMFGSKVQ